jgi:murein DD-endopeptidase MepM/ murein hydrolase activator NlpD
MLLHAGHETTRRIAAHRKRAAALRIAIAATIWLGIVCLMAASHASAHSGGAVFELAGDFGGVSPTSPVNKAPAKKKQRKASPPVISGVQLVPTTLLAEGYPLTLRYRVKARSGKVRVRLIVRSAGGKYIRTAQLGVHRTRVLQVTKLTQDELGVRRAGRYRLRLAVTDGKGRRAVRAAGVKAWTEFQLAAYRFPVVGNFSFGGDGARFGAGRPGHIHQGQDVVADSGTPLVSPHAGTVTWVKYQAEGAGYYVVVDGTDGRDYVFMHLLKGSAAFKKGDTVKTGGLIGRVGATGDASGPHLHFEVWIGGPWQFGGHPIDPLPLLRAWFAMAPGGAVQTAGVASSAPLDND